MTDYWTLQIDPEGVAPNRAMLDLNDGAISLGTPDGSAPIDWGSASITAYETQQGQYGNLPVEFVLPNRTVTISLLLGGTGYEDDQETARSQLQQKVARLQAEGGVLMRQRGDGAPMYADIVNATLTIPDQWGETGDVEPAVQLVLECLPDFYTDEIQLDTIYATGVASAQLTLDGEPATIEGDYPARCRFVVQNTSTNDQHGMLWALQSKHASTSTAAALAIPAKLMTPLNGSVIAGGSGGAINDHIMYFATVGNSSWTPFTSTTLASGNTALLHQGTFRVWVRAIVTNMTIRLVWGQGSLSVPATNTQVSPPSGQWTMVDLGVVRIEPTPDGSATEWIGVVQCLDNGIAHSVVQLDEWYFQPIDESAGQLSSVAVPDPTTVNQLGIGSTGANAGLGGPITLQEWTFSETPAGVVSATVGGEIIKGSFSYSDQLLVTNFRLSVPSSATITGVTANITTGSPDTSGESYVCDNLIQLVVAGAPVGANLSAGRQWSPWTTSIGTYGGPTNLWGTTLTPGQVNASNFGVGIQAAASIAGGEEMTNWGQVVQVDVTVTYSLVTGLAVAQDAVVYAAQTMQLATAGITRLNNTGTVNGPVSAQIGDLPRLPPSGLEGRPATLLVRSTRGDLNTAADTAPDTFTVTPYYWPTFLGRI